MEEPEVKKAPAPIPVETPLKIYMSRANTYFGKTLIKELGTQYIDQTVTKKVDHTFYTSDTSIDNAKKEGIADIWPVKYIYNTFIRLGTTFT